MHAMAMLAIDLQWEDELDEALTINRKLMEWNPTDNQGVHYNLASCLYEAKCSDELDRFFVKYDDEVSASLSYIKALHIFRKYGASERTNQALLKAHLKLTFTYRSIWRKSCLCRKKRRKRLALVTKRSRSIRDGRWISLG